MKLREIADPNKPMPWWLIALIIGFILLGLVICLSSCGGGGGSSGGSGNNPPPIQQYGSVEGTVTDERIRAAVPGVTVQVVGYELLQTITDLNGFYRIDQILIGEQILRFFKPGYTSFDQSIIVVANQTTFVPNVTLSPSRPQLDSIVPNSGPVGTPATLSGLGFGTGQGTVIFGGLASDSYTGWNDTQIVCTVPDTATTGVVRVIASGVSSTENVEFTIESPPPLPPVITEINPTSGTIGSTVTITGSNFGADQDTSVVTFGGLSSDSYAGWGETQIVCTVPDGAVTGDVIVTTSAGTSNAVTFTVTGPLSYTFAWRGTGLNNPWNMTYNVVTGHICIANYGDNNIARFDPNGNQLSSITDTSFDHPGGVASDSDGNYYVTNAPGMNIRKVFKFDSAWSNKMEWNTTYRPVDIAAEFGNYVVVLETQNGVDGYVEVFDRDGNLQYGPWTVQTSNSLPSIALDPTENIWIVVPYSHLVRKYSPDGALLGSFGEYGSGEGQFKYCWGIEVASDSKIYVTDWENYRFQVFDAAFNFLAEFGAQGSGDGQFQFSGGICVENSNVYVSDHTNNNIQKFIPNP